MSNSRTPAVENGDPGTKPYSNYPKPRLRTLRIFSFDPAADIELANAAIGRCSVQVPWEEVEPGPVGEQIEVVDVDPSSQCAYDPVDLSHPHLLAQDGFEPSTGNPQFHQQMVYAVAMKTVHNFEQVLGRRIQWSERLRDENGRQLESADRRYVPRLRIYPHALREQNAYYSPEKKSLLFGYFNAPSTDPRDALPGGVVFTCLSHDIVTHETTHAILDGLHRRLLDATNHDMLAFHEAFADIVAIFQHFTLPGVLLAQIQHTRGDLRADSLLVRLASQFARATGRGDALRNALGDRGPDGRPVVPDPWKLGRTTSPHERGAILVAAVFDAFLQIYEDRTADLRRIATGGTGVLPLGSIHPDLAGRLADEAAHASQRVLNICIRALDYLPPVDITFGDYLRALITADLESFPDDPRRYRLAFIQAFRDRGIYPNDVRALGEDSLRWTELDDDAWRLLKDCLPPAEVLRTMAYAYDSETPRTSSIKERNVKQLIEHGEDRDLAAMAVDFLNAYWVPGKGTTTTDTGRLGSRYGRYRMEQEFAQFLRYWLLSRVRSVAGPDSDQDRAAARKRQKIGYHFGLDLKAVYQRGEDEDNVRLEVHAVRPAIRVRSQGGTKVELLVLITQSVRHHLDGDPRENSDGPHRSSGAGDDRNGGPLTYMFRGGCTLLIDPENGRVRYAIGKNVGNDRRRARQELFLRQRVDHLGMAAMDRFGLTPPGEACSRGSVEPFALTHRGADDEGDGYG